MKRTAKAFAPGGISSFFEICDRTKNDLPIDKLEFVGARGGGFGTKMGVLSEVIVSESDENCIEVMINETASKARTTRTTVEMLLEKTSGCYDVLVKHRVDIPIGSGFGSSAAGSLSAALALSKALNLPLTYNQIGRVAHVAEIRCKTGLGTVGPLMIGGCVLSVEPGAPGISVIDRIPIQEDFMIVAGVFGPTPTHEILSSTEKREKINFWGRKTFNRILQRPSVENFLDSCLTFAEKAGFMTPRVEQLVNLAKDVGVVGVAQNMVGEAVHALVFREKAAVLAEAFKEVLPEENVLVSEIDFRGARLIGNERV